MDSFRPDNRTAFERIQDQDWYIADESVAQLSNHAVKVLAEFEKDFVSNPLESQQHLRSLFGSFGDNSFIRSGLRVDYGINIHFGNNSFANYGVVLLDVAPIYIGHHVLLGTNVQILTPIHPIDSIPRKAGWESARSITIRDNVWIGSGAIVLAGVTVGENSVIGAGSVVTKDVPANVVLAGNPARVIRSITD